jgi:hypothetical protein
VYAEVEEKMHLKLKDECYRYELNQAGTSHVAMVTPFACFEIIYQKKTQFNINELHNNPELNMRGDPCSLSISTFREL